MLPRRAAQSNKCHSVGSRFAALAFVVSCSATAIAAVQPLALRPDQIDDRLQSAAALQQAGKDDEARRTFEDALESANLLKLDRQRAHALLGLAQLDNTQGNYAVARTRALQSLELYEQLAAAGESAGRIDMVRGLARVNVLLASLAGFEGNRSESRQRAERAIAAYESIGDRGGRARATLQLMRDAVDANDPTRPVLYARAIDDARAASDRVLEAGVLHSFGDWLFTSGKYAEAFENLEAAAAIYRDAGRQVALGTTYNSLGRLYRAHGRLDAALASQLQALALHEKAGAAFNHLQSLNAVAVTYAALGDARARTYFERALALAEASKVTRVLDFLRANYADALLGDGEYARAIEILEGVVARNLDAYPSLRMGDLSNAYMKIGRVDAAMAWAEKAVATCGADDYRACAYALGRRADARSALGNQDAALADLQTAMQSIEALRARLVPADFFKQQFQVAQQDLYSRAIALQIRRGDTAAALETAERARSRAFVDLLASRTASPAPAAGGALLSDAAVPAASLADVSAAAARLRSTVLAYWTTTDSVFIWVVTPDGRVRAARSDVRPSKLQELIRATMPHEGPSVAAKSSAWRDLYELLVEPVRDALPRAPNSLLTIIPHGPVAAVAFAGLQDARGRYLLEDYALHYAPSGAALQFTDRGERHDGRTGSVLMVADPLTPPRARIDEPLPRLPGARAESRAGAALKPIARVTRFEGDDARESAIRGAVAGKAVLHFATHAIVRDEDPFASFLALARSDQDDGLLTAHEIYNLRLDADLVVLSACRSAGGRVTGDGIATFARAFIYAGAPSIIASLWEVADQPVNQLMPQFYRSWLAGQSKARALRSAQLRMLQDLRAGKVHADTPAGRVTVPEHPVFWAGFALLGEPD